MAGRLWACMFRSARAALAMVAIVVPLSLPSTGGAQVTASAQASERSVMAAYVYRFIGYVEWPALAFSSAETPIVIGVVNADELAAELEQIVQGRTAQDRRVQVRRMAPNEPWTGVHMVFIGRGAAPKAIQAARGLAGAPVLTITDLESGIDQPAMINFIQVDGRVRFEVNVAAAEKSGLRLSSRLLTVATRVKAG